ncbi:MAG: hypothetical protein AAFR61_29195 [Bacteroidota bacterium]
MFHIRPTLFGLWLMILVSFCWLACNPDGVPKASKGEISLEIENQTFTSAATAIYQDGTVFGLDMTNIIQLTEGSKLFTLNFLADEGNFEGPAFDILEEAELTLGNNTGKRICYATYTDDPSTAVYYTYGGQAKVTQLDLEALEISASFSLWLYNIYDDTDSLSIKGSLNQVEIIQ